MNTVLAALALALVLGSCPRMDWTEQEASPAAAQSGAPAQSMPQFPAPVPVSPMGTASNAVQITNGPVVEILTDTTAQIAWSTNVNAGTTLRYGTDPGHLDQTAGMPWGGLTHRVTIKNLSPNTTYYFSAESSQGQGTGTQAQTGPSSFQTRPAGTQESRK
jgi:hypothetical protein